MSGPKSIARLIATPGREADISFLGNPAGVLLKQPAAQQLRVLVHPPDQQVSACLALGAGIGLQRVPQQQDGGLGAG